MSHYGAQTESVYFFKTFADLQLRESQPCQIKWKKIINMNG